MVSRFIVLDTETTGYNPEEGAALLELAYVVVEKNDKGAHTQWDVTDGDSWFIRYDGVIPPEVRAVHHIGPHDVGPDSGAMDRDATVHAFLAAEEPGDVYAAHNAPFDRQFLPEFSDKPWIDTYRAALHLLPDAPSYKNQALRYYLDLQPRAEFLEGLAPHRALYDTAVTAELLVHLLTLAPPEELIHLSTQPVLETVCNFGQAHKGKLWSEVPRSYLNWILFKSDVPSDPVKNMDLLYTARHWYEAN
jgi:exodeoxyribonuclease X